MVDYRRFISYIYAYKNGKKMENRGFVRVESRNGRCRVYLHMDIANQQSSKYKVYMLVSDDHRYIGIEAGILMRGSQGHFTQLEVITETDHLFGAQYSLKQVSGMVILGEDGSIYGTRWNDEPLETGYFRSEQKQGENIVAFSAYPTVDANILESEKQDEQKVYFDNMIDIKNYEKTQRESELVKNVIEVRAEDETAMQPKEIDLSSHKEEKISDSLLDRDFSSDQDSSKEALGVHAEELLKENERAFFADDFQAKLQEETIPKNGEAGESVQRQAGGQEVLCEEKIIPSGGLKEKEGKKKEDYLRSGRHYVSTLEQREKAVYEDLLHEMPQMYPFDDNVVEMCVRLDLQDIGKLPVKYWFYASNSFLLHGYYCYRHIILARVSASANVNETNKLYRDIYQKVVDKVKVIDSFNGKNGRQNGRYILGVPGINLYKEQYMANLFGFQKFKPVTQENKEKGAFGYFYVQL